MSLPSIRSYLSTDVLHFLFLFLPDPSRRSPASPTRQLPGRHPADFIASPTCPISMNDRGFRLLSLAKFVLAGLRFCDQFDLETLAAVACRRRTRITCRKLSRATSSPADTGPSCAAASGKRLRVAGRASPCQSWGSFVPPITVSPSRGHGKTDGQAPSSAFWRVTVSSNLRQGQKQRLSAGREAVGISEANTAGVHDDGDVSGGMGKQPPSLARVCIRI